MKKQETSIQFLDQFLPPGAFEHVAPFFQSHIIHLTLTHERKSVMGDYRHPWRANPHHRISVNATLNPYSFLVTLLHELAHMRTYIHFQNRVQPHGKEWKEEFRKILVDFIGKRLFPPDVEKALIAYLHNPAASTCTDPHLYKALYKYDKRKSGHQLVESFKIKACFATDDGQIFRMEEKMRTRYRCKSLHSGKMYLFQGIMEVRAVENEVAERQPFYR